MIKRDFQIVFLFKFRFKSKPDPPIHFVFSFEWIKLHSSNFFCILKLKELKIQLFFLCLFFSQPIDRRTDRLPRRDRLWRAHHRHPTKAQGQGSTRRLHNSSLVEENKKHSHSASELTKKEWKLKSEKIKKWVNEWVTQNRHRRRNFSERWIFLQFFFVLGHHPVPCCVMLNPNC